MEVKEFLEELKESINDYPELYSHCKIDLVAIKIEEDWNLASGIIRLGTGDLLSIPQSLPAPEEFLHISKVIRTQDLLNILSGVTGSKPSLEIDETIIYLPIAKESLEPYIFPLFDTNTIQSEMGGFGILYRLVGQSLYKLTSGIISALSRSLTEHHQSQASDIYQYIERATGVPCKATHSMTLDILLPTYSRIQKVWFEGNTLYIDYECPQVFHNDPGTPVFQVSHKNQSGNMNEIHQKSGLSKLEVGVTKSYETKDLGIIFLGSLYKGRRPLSLAWPDDLVPKTGTLRVNLSHRKKKKLLCFYEEELGPPEIDHALSSLFSKIQHYVDDTISKLDPEIAIGLRRLLIDVESDITGLDVRDIGGRCRSIIQETLLKIQDDDDYRDLEIEKTIVRVKMLVTRLRISDPNMSDRLSDHLKSFTNYFSSLNDVVQRGHHNQKENLIEEDARSLVAHLFLWLNDLFRLLDSAGWSPNSKKIVS